MNTRKRQQCNRCHRQPSITAGTIFEATKLPLAVWFHGLYFMIQDKKGASAMTLHRQLHRQLGGSVQRDDAYLGGERSGGKRGRGAPGKTPFVAAVETNEQGHPQRVTLTVVEGFRVTEVAAWAQQTPPMPERLLKLCLA